MPRGFFYEVISSSNQLYRQSNYVDNFPDHGQIKVDGGKTAVYNRFNKERTMLQKPFIVAIKWPNNRILVECFTLIMVIPHA